MRSVFIDAGGHVHSALPAAISDGQAALGAEGLARYAVKNMEYVWAAEGPSGVSVHLRPSRLSPSALAAVFYYISDVNPDRVALTYFTDSWRSELVPGCLRGIARLAELVEAAGVGQSRNIVAQEISLRDHNAAGELQALTTLWKPRVTWREFADFLGKVSEQTRDRYVLFEHETAQDTFVIRDFGAGIPDWGKDYLASAKGRSIEDLPDYDFRRFCASKYQKAVRDLSPRLEKIDARIYWPRHGTRTSKFWRLTLPVIDPADRIWLLSATAADANINLRTDAA